MNALTTIPQSIALTITPQGHPHVRACVCVCVRVCVCVNLTPLQEQNATQGQFLIRIKQF